MIPVFKFEIVLPKYLVFVSSFPEHLFLLFPTRDFLCISGLLALSGREKVGFFTYVQQGKLYDTLNQSDLKEKSIDVETDPVSAMIGDVRSVI